MDGDFGIRQQFAEAVDHESLVGDGEKCGVVDEENDRRRSDGGLRGVIDAGLATAGGAGGSLLQHLANGAIELAGGQAGEGLFVQSLGFIEHGLNVAAVFCGDKRDRGVIDPAEFFVEILAIFFHDLRIIRRLFAVLGVFFFGQIPFVDDQNHGLELLGDVLGEFFVGLTDGIDAVDEHEDHIGPADRALGAMETVEGDVVGGDLAFFADARGVDDDEGFAIFLESDIHAVPGCAGDFGDDDALGVAVVERGDGVDQRALAGVALADDGEHQGCLGHLSGGIGEIDFFGDGVEEIIEISAGEGGDADGGAETELGKFAKGEISFGSIGFVGDEESWDIFFAEELGDFLIGVVQAGLDIDNEQHEISAGHRQVDLMANVFGELVGVFVAVSAGIDEFDKVVVDEDGHGDAVAGDAGHVLNDADEFARQSVEEAALADIGSADDGDDGHGWHGGDSMGGGIKKLAGARTDAGKLKGEGESKSVSSLRCSFPYQFPKVNKRHSKAIKCRRAMEEAGLAPRHMEIGPRHSSRCRVGSGVCLT